MSDYLDLEDVGATDDVLNDVEADVDVEGEFLPDGDDLPSHDGLGESPDPLSGRDLEPHFGAAGDRDVTFPDGQTVRNPPEDALHNIYRTRDEYLHGNNPHTINPQSGSATPTT